MIEFNGVVFSYPNESVTIDNINLSIADGESVGIIGANGAGKSTLLYLLAGVMLPTSGYISVNGTAYSKSNIKTARKDVGLVFQNSDDQLFTTSVYDDVAFGPRNMGLSKDDVSAVVDETLKTCGVEGIKNKAPYKISGGEKKLAAIASVMSMKPAVIVMDEPSASLDPKARRDIINMLNGIKSTKIIASHDLDMILDICTRVVVLNKGKVIADNTPNGILTDEDLLAKAHLELPLRFQK